MKILHIVHDEKFIDGLIATFESLNSDSKFVILTSNEGEKNVRWIRNRTKVSLIEVDSSEYKGLLECRDFTHVWVHYLDEQKARFVCQLLKPTVKIIWGTWGGDYICMTTRQIHGVLTSLRILSGLNIRGRIGWLGRNMLATLGLGTLLCSRYIREFLTKVDFYSCVVESENEIIAPLLNKTARPIVFHYMNPGAKFDEQLKCDLTKKNIWVGNSATFSNNYFEVFHVLKKHSDWSVVAPLSYGKDRDAINEYGRKCFHDRWCPLMSFMPYPEYMKKMAACSIFVFGHYRQQALGNVLAALRIGGCVYLSKKNPIFQYLIKRGIVVYSLDDLGCRMEECIARHYEVEAHNRLLVNRMYDQQECLSQIQASLDMIGKTDV